MSKINVDAGFKKSSCILCSINCGLDIKTGGKDGRELIKIKGDRENPLSEGYLCNKAARLNYYQMGADRLSTPMRRRDDGSYESVDWNTAIREVSAGLINTKKKYGGEKILYIGGGGQGNHLGGTYADGVLKTLGVKYRTNSLAQEKTGEFWVNGKMFGGGPHGDFEHAEVAMFIGKNPWQAHGFPQTRKVMREIAKDSKRSMIVLDPCTTDSAKMADYHLRLKPGTDAWCLSGIIATIVQEGLEDKKFIDEHTTGFDDIKGHFNSLSISEYSGICEVDEELVRNTARRIAKSSSVAVMEDLGVQQNINSTLVSYLQRIMWVITGNFAKKGANNIPVAFISITDAGKSGAGPMGKDKNNERVEKVSPVLGTKIITGLLPCNTIAEEILTDHPDRFRAAIIESSNPVHAYANSQSMREAIRSLNFSVVIDVAMTETAQQASYVLPASTSYEKYECIFFPVEFPRNFFQLRNPVVEPLVGTLIEAEIHTRILEEMGVVKKHHITLLRWSAKINRKVFAMTLLSLTKLQPKLMNIIPALLYRSLGTTLDNGKAASASVLWAFCHSFVQKNRRYASNAGFTGSSFTAGEKMFETLMESQSGFFFTDSGSYSDSWARMKQPNKRIQLYLNELIPGIESLDTALLNTSKKYPFVLTAGQRRAETANVIIRDSSWDRKNKIASLYIHPEDALSLDVVNGDDVRISTKAGSAVTYVEVTEIQRPGFVSLPNGVGLDYTNEDGENVRVGIPPNELTSREDRDFFAGTPWHKYVPAKIEKVTVT